MKRILQILLLACTFVSCSTDTDSLIDNAGANTSTQKNEASVLRPECFKNLTGYYDNTGTFQYPVWTFTTNTTNVAPADNAYKIQLEIQGTDCEDITVGIGSITVYPGNTFYDINNNHPSISKKPSDLPSCYRWRLRLTGVDASGNITCIQYTAWYDMPIG